MVEPLILRDRMVGLPHRKEPVILTFPIGSGRVRPYQSRNDGPDMDIPVSSGFPQ
jgi:hypothetical protein